LLLILVEFLLNFYSTFFAVLQELYEGAEKPENLVDGWNAWFFSDLQRLPQVWSGLGKNQMSPSELWLGFLDYYSAQFDIVRVVICSRLSRPLTKFEKMWNSPCIAIEDPFDLSHNLGAGISRRSKLII
jgi:terminal uridylyltransferase